MSGIVLVPRETPSVSLDAECLTPDRIADLSESQVAALPVRLGTADLELGELFHIRGSGSDEIRIEGDAAWVKRIGYGMSHGRIVVEGDVGMHAGARMKGGVLEIEGNAGAWAGAEMSGGQIRIRGDAADHVGAAYPGARRGMTGGTILIEGSAGSELGAVMRRGTILARGKAGDRVGFNMIAGSIVLCGGAGRWPGAGMKRGSIISLAPLGRLPTFRRACAYRPDYLRVLVRRLERDFDIGVGARFRDGLYERYSGDFTELGRGEILIWGSA